jgi:hypothetical protein
MAIRDVALKIKRWAQANQMIGLSKESPPVDIETIRNVFHGIGVPIATQILQDRGISYIGVNDINNEITIFTKRRLTAKDKRTLEQASYTEGEARYAIAFRSGNIAHAGPKADLPIGIAPYHKIEDRYTCGSSVYIGSEKGAGTLGCLVRDRTGGQLYGLSANHVTGGSNYAAPGLPIVAPGSLDVTAGGADPTTLGHHSDAYPFIDGLPDAVEADENLDAAIFTIADPNIVTSMQRAEYDTPSDCVPLAVGMRVTKVGRTTGKTNGTVVSELFDFEPIYYELDIIGGKKVVYFKSLFTILGDTQPFSHAGDSGSLIVTTTDEGVKKAVGIVVAADDNASTFALSVDRILAYFDVELVGDHNT